MFVLKHYITTVLLVSSSILTIYPKSVVLRESIDVNDIRRANTIVVESEIDLKGKTIKLPSKTKLLFNGGSINNGKIVFDRTRLDGDVKIYSQVAGSIANKLVYLNWFLKDNDLDVLYNTGVFSLTGMKEMHLYALDYVISVRSMTYGISVKNIIIDGEGCVITAKKGGRVIDSLLPFKNCEKITIKNINLYGSDVESSETGARHNMMFSNCMNVRIENIVSKNSHTDGLYLINCKKFQINSFKAFSSGRQGCSITNAQSIVFKGCVFDGSYRFAPKSGLDIEPNYETDVIDNIVIKNCRFTNNQEAGITIGLAQRTPDAVSNITITDCEFDSNGFNIGVSSTGNSGRGSIDIGNCLLKNSRGVSFQSKCYSAINTPIVKFHDSIIENTNTAGGNNIREQATFISVHNISGRPVQSDYGNIILKNLTLKQKDHFMDNLKAAITIYPDPLWQISNVNISKIFFVLDGNKHNANLLIVPQTGLKNVKIKM